MKTRVITGVLLAAALLAVYFLSSTWVMPLFFALLSAIAVFEIHRCVGIKKLLTLIPAEIFAILLPVCARGYGNEQSFLNFAYKMVIILVFALGMSSVFSKGKIGISSVGTAFLLDFYSVMSFSGIVLLRDYENGSYIFLLVILCPWITDTFAYFSGVLFGKHKLIPDVSPKKTVEGSIGGTLCCGLMFLIFGLILKETNPEIHVNFVSLAIVGLIMSMASQCGDLLFSVVKRKYGVKDYGKIFPGHGGVLDRFDSVIAVSPFLLIMFDLSPFFRFFY